MLQPWRCYFWCGYCCYSKCIVLWMHRAYPYRNSRHSNKHWMVGIFRLHKSVRVYSTIHICGIDCQRSSNRNRYVGGYVQQHQTCHIVSGGNGTIYDGVWGHRHHHMGRQSFVCVGFWKHYKHRHLFLWWCDRHTTGEPGRGFRWNIYSGGKQLL